MPASSDPDLWAACDAWLHRAEAVIAASADALDTLNVFPVSDSDTGSNLKHTLRGIVAAVPRFHAGSLDAVVQSAILSAHGNSGAIVAEMFTSVCRSLPRQGVRGLPSGTLVALLMRTVASAATEAVARPVAGTILTVADDAATAAELAAADHPHDALAVVCAAQTGAHEALARTPDQLAVLADNGVVDAGGQAFVLLVDVLVEVLGGEPATALTDVGPRIVRPQVAAGSSGSGASAGETNGIEYEVMYALRGASRPALDALRRELSDLGHSVVVVGEESVAQVHVHCIDPGPTVEVALGFGSLSEIRITALDVAAVVETTGRTVVSMVAGPGLAEAVRAQGGVAIETGWDAADRGPGKTTLDRLSAVVGQTCGDLILLPNDMEHLELATHLALTTKSARRRVAVIPTVAQIQGLAALAVHEPSADFDAAVVAMSTAAGHARHGGVTIAESPAMTMAGRCGTGDVLGILEGDFVEIGDSVVEVAWRVIERLLHGAGELLTLVTGLDADAGLVDELSHRVRRAAPTVDVEHLSGGQRRYVLLMGLE